MTSKRDSAIALAKQGRRVFPLVPNGKTPALEGNWRKTASSDPARVAEMWTCPVMESELDYNIGIALDANTLVVDVDVRDGKQGAQSVALLEAIYEPLPITRTVRSASGGLHREYQALQPIGNSASKIGKNIDIKSEGGFVVAPGSVIDGIPYVLEIDVPVVPVPAFIHTLAGEIRERPQRDTAGTTEDTESAKGRAIDYLRNRAPLNGTYVVACKVREYGIERDTCIQLMLEHWRDHHNLDKTDDHIEFRVNNAYSYGAKPGRHLGARSRVRCCRGRRERHRLHRAKALYALRWRDAEPDFEQQYLIDDVMDLGVMVVTYGDSNVGKTYVKLDQCFHIAAGKDWNGHKVKQGLVVYVAAEGGKGFLRRMKAFKLHYGVTDLPFSLVPCPIDLQSEASDTSKLVKLIREEEAHFGQKCVLIVIDTLARAMAGGDENTAVDMSKFVGHSDRLRAATGATVDVIHHTGKDKAKGARGSSALRAATDTEIEIGEGIFEAKKQRDMARGDPLNFELVNVDVGSRSDGKQITACVVRWITASEFDERISPMAGEMLAALERILDAKRDEIEDDESISERDKRDMIESVKSPWKEWQLSCLSCLKGPRGKSVTRSNLFPLRLELYNSGKIKNDKLNQWFIV
jgi:hypothetical protein